MTEVDTETGAGIAELAGSEDLEPAAVARLVAELPEETMRELVTGEVITAACEQIIRRFPDYVDADRTRGVHAAVGWVITGGDGDERFVVAFDDGAIDAGRELELEPRVTLELDAVDFLRLATGNADPATLFLSGRLGLSGDELFAIEMASFLRIPGADGETPAGKAIDPSVVDAARIAAVVRDAPDEALQRGMQGAIREVILEEVFRRFPEYFKRGPLGGSEVAIAFKITGRADGDADRYRVLIRDQEVVAGRDLDVDPRVTIVIDGVDFLKLVTGNANPVLSFITGKLKIKGDLGFAAQIPGLFRIPTAAG
jgi:putative sterol carrier protein